MKKFNIDYFRPFGEMQLIRKCAARIVRVECNNSTMLFIAPVLIGDFAAMIPALIDYMERHPKWSYDIVVTTHQIALAERMKGIRKVYGANSIAQRKDEGKTALMPENTYEEVMILRASKDVLDNVIPHIRAKKVITKLMPVIQYSVVHLGVNAQLGRPSMRWRDFNFSLLGSTPRNMPLENMLAFTDSDHARVKGLSVLSDTKPNIIVHFGASWPMMHWPNERWSDLLEQVKKTNDCNIIFVGSKKDLSNHQMIISQMSVPTQSLIGKIDILDLTVLLSMSDLFIGIDSGPANLAHLVGLQSVVLYGPGPHTFMSHLESDVIIDRSKGRGLYERFFIRKEGFIHRIAVNDVYKSLCELLLIQKNA